MTPAIASRSERASASESSASNTRTPSPAVTTPLLKSLPALFCVYTWWPGMICLKVPEVGARLAGACAAAAVESASTIATNIASLVFIAVPRSGQPGELRVDQLVQRDVLRREILQPAARLLVASCLYLPEDVNVLGEGGGIRQRDHGRLQLAPPEIDHERPDLHELAGDLRQAGDLRHEVVLVEPVRTRFGVDLRVGLRPGARPVAGKAAARDLVAATLVHRTLPAALQAAVHAGSGIGARLHVHARPVVVGRGARDHLDHPDVVVVDVDEAGDDAAVFRTRRRVAVRVAARARLDRLASAAAHLTLLDVKTRTKGRAPR